MNAMNTIVEGNNPLKNIIDNLIAQGIKAQLIKRPSFLKKDDNDQRSRS